MSCIPVNYVNLIPITPNILTFFSTALASHLLNDPTGSLGKPGSGFLELGWVGRTFLGLGSGRVRSFSTRVNPLDGLIG